MDSEPGPIRSDDIADGGLIDVTRLSMTSLRDALDGSSLERALARILTSGQQSVGHHGFSNSI